MSIIGLDSDSMCSDEIGYLENVREQGLVPVENSLCHNNEGGITNPEPSNTQVNANLSKCETVQLGNKFVADNITFVFGNSETRTQSRHDIANSVFDTFNVKSDFNKLNKTKTIDFRIVNLILSAALFILIFVVIIKINKIPSEPEHFYPHTVVYMNNTTTNIPNLTIFSEEIKSSNYSAGTSLKPETTKKDQIIYETTSAVSIIPYSTESLPPTNMKTTFNTHSHPPSAEGLHSTQNTKDAQVVTRNTQPLWSSTGVTLVETTNGDKSSTGLTLASQFSTTFTTVETPQDLITDNTTPISVSPFKGKTEPHYNNTVLILSKLYRGFEVDSIPSASFNPSSYYKPIQRVVIEFYPTYCQLLSTCMKFIRQIPAYDKYSFFFLENFLYYDKGWKVPMKPNKDSDPSFFRVLIMFRDKNEISEKQMYLYLLLINTSIRCGYLDSNFSVQITGDKYYKNKLGYSKFMNIINNSTENRYYVDERENFVLDSVNLSDRIPKPCPPFRTCNSTCSDQTCLQTVCETPELCFLQCL